MTLIQELQTSLKIVKSEKKLVSIITAVVFFWGLLYVGTLYEPKYRSEARLWIKKANMQTQIDPVVVYNDSQNPLSPVAQAGNPILTQMEILKSTQISQDLTNYINHHYPKENPSGLPITMKKHLKLKNKIGTDIIEVSFTWDDPKLSQQFLDRILTNYKYIVDNTNSETKRKRRQFIDKKIIEVEKDLADIDEKIKDYKKAHDVITLQSESDQLTQRKSDIETTLAKVKMQKDGALNRVRDLQSRLGITNTKALNNSMITYDNKAYLQLQDSLNAAMQDYLEKRSVLADTNPKLIALKDKVDYLEFKMEEINSNPAMKKSNGKRLTINDPVTANIAEDLAQSQSNYKDFAAQEQALNNTLSGLKTEYINMSDKEYTLTQLESMQSVMLSAYRSLRTQQIEAHMNEAEDISNIFSVDQPSLPHKPVPITAVQYLILSLMAGGTLGIFVALIKHKLQQMTLYKDTVVAVTHKPILGRVPWFSRYADFLANQDTMDHAYKGIVTGLKLQTEKENERIVVFASPDAENSRKFVMVYDIAKTMAKLNYRVALVDCHLRRPAVLRQETVQGVSTLDRLQEAEEGAESTGQVSVLTRNIGSYIEEEGVEFPIFESQPILPDAPNLVLYGVNDFVKNPYEFFNGNEFHNFVQDLKQEYDWVFIDTPFGHQAPEFPLIAREADAAVMMLKHQLTESSLREATCLLEEWNIKLLGTIVREYSPNFN